VRTSVEAKPDAPGRATLRLGIGKPDTGDPDNRLVEITFPGPTARLQERHVALLDELLGSNEEPVVNASHDRALMAASRRAKKAVLKHKSRYTRAPPFGEQLMVKAPFTTSEGGREWMWVEIVRWEGSRIFGVLQNVPQDVPGLKQGARVEVEESSIFDYLLQRQDGSQEGNETGVLLKQRR
jgi:uncharacterized protein YegJ (DUF2314 family)